MISAVYFLLGILVGTLNVLSQAWTLQRITPASPRAAYIWVFAGFVLRTALAIALLLIAVQSGVIAALLALAGILIGRWIALVVYS
jgi:hypothetical protein